MSDHQYTITADQITDAVITHWHAKRTPLFLGSPGIGKTAFVREAAAHISMQLVKSPVVVRELHLASMSEVDIRGYLIPNGDQATFTKPEFWASVEQNPYGILFLDEFVQATHEVQKAVAPLLLERRIGEYTLPEGWRVVLAGNELDDNAGANTLLSHIVNRVTIIHTLAPDVDMWVSWAANEGLEPECIAFAKLRPHAVFNTDPGVDPNDPYCTPRSLHSASDIAKGYPGGLQAMVNSPLGMALLAGAVGKGAATELSALVRTAMTLPSYEEVVAAPTKTPIPSEPSLMYAMVMLVVVRCKVEDANAVTEYLTRFDPNYTVTGLVALCRRNKVFVAAAPASKWIMANQKLLGKFARFITAAV